MTEQEAIKYLIMPAATSTNPGEEYIKQREAYEMAKDALRRNINKNYNGEEEKNVR